MEQHVKFGSRVIDFSLQYYDRKTLGIKVYPDGKVKVLSPYTAKQDEVIDKVRQKSPWILRQIDYFSSYKPTTPKRRYINGETHLYLGRQYRLKIVPDIEKVVKAYRGQLWIHSIDTSPESLKRQLDAWYKERAVIVINELLEEVLPKFKRYKISSPHLLIRFMNKRWGSCTPAGRIILNTELVKAPKSCIEYVIVHEMCHLVHHNHKRAFQVLQSRILPDWQQRKAKLEQILL